MSFQKTLLIFSFFLLSQFSFGGVQPILPSILTDAKIIGVWKLNSAVEKKTAKNMISKFEIQTITLSADHIYTIKKSDNSTSTGIWKLNGASIELNADPDYMDVMLEGNHLRANTKIEGGKKNKKSQSIEVVFDKIR